MEQKHIDQGIRLKELIKILKMNQLAFAKSLGMAQSNISKMMNGERQLSLEALNLMSERHNVNLHWLITGKGQMFVGDEQHMLLQTNEGQATYGKDRLDALEERIERLEEVVKRLV